MSCLVALCPGGAKARRRTAVVPGHRALEVWERREQGGGGVGWGEREVGRKGQECEGTRSLVLTLTRFCETPIQFNAWEFNMQTRASLRLFNTKFTTFCVPVGSIKTLRVTKLWGFSRAREQRQGVGSLSRRQPGGSVAWRALPPDRLFALP